MGNFGEVIDRLYTVEGVATPTATPRRPHAHAELTATPSTTPTITPSITRTPTPGGYHLTADTFHLISLGCAKTLSNSDSMSQLLLQDGYRIARDAAHANVLIVNTCRFIGPAKKEIAGCPARTPPPANVRTSPDRGRLPYSALWDTSSGAGSRHRRYPGHASLDGHRAGGARTANDCTP